MVSTITKPNNITPATTLAEQRVVFHLNLQETPTKTVLSLVMGGMEG
ncbi:MAG: hypothetical protein ACKO11_16385 [Cuspidothrix sp.]